MGSRSDVERRLVGIVSATDVTAAVTELLGQLAKALATDALSDRPYANRMRAVGVLWGYGNRDELEAAGADLIVGDPAELKALAG